MAPPGGDRTWLALLVLGCGGYLVATGLVKGVALLCAAGVVVVIVAAGLWAAQPWGRLLGTALFAGYAAWFAWGFVLKANDVFLAAGALMCAFLSLHIWRTFRKPA